VYSHGRRLMSHLQQMYPQQAVQLLDIHDFAEKNCAGGIIQAGIGCLAYLWCQITQHCNLLGSLSFT
jgi:hypothetical protein